MIGPGTGAREYLVFGVTDMRNGIAGLSAFGWAKNSPASAIKRSMGWRSFLHGIRRNWRSPWFQMVGFFQKGASYLLFRALRCKAKDDYLYQYH